MDESPVPMGAVAAAVARAPAVVHFIGATFSVLTRACPKRRPPAQESQNGSMVDTSKCDPAGGRLMAHDAGAMPPMDGVPPVDPLKAAAHWFPRLKL